MAKGPASFWAPYLDVLRLASSPDDLLEDWLDTELEWLQDECVSCP
jgi:hypothetical protein